MSATASAGAHGRRLKSNAPSAAGRERISYSTKLTHALKNPNRALSALNYELASGSLIDFTEVFWPVIEPGRPFVRGWAVEAICDHLEAVSAGYIQKLLINVPPGLMKSLTTNVLWPAWEWGPRNRPDLRYIGASYSQDLTVRDNRRCRQIIESDAYQEMFGDRFHLVDDQNAKVRYDTDKRGFKIATSVGGMGTGERADRFIIDDPHNVKTAESETKLDEVAQWFTEVVPTRINDPKRSVFLAIMQRVHERDLSGLVLAADLGYTHLMLPMEYEPDRKCFTDLGAGRRFEDPRLVEGELLFPERFDRAYLEGDLKPTLSSWGGQYAVSGQLQQSPTPRGGGMFKVDREEVLRRAVDVAPAGGRWRRGWDIAGSTTKKSPFTASVRLKEVGDVIYIGDVTRERKEIEEAEAHIVETANLDGLTVKQDIPQDPGSSGKSQKRHLAGRLRGLDFVFSTETGSKEDRAIPIASQWNAGNVVLVKGPRFSVWVDAFLAELSSFPRGEFKDQVDALSRAYAGLLGLPKESAPVGGEVIGIEDVDAEDLPADGVSDDPLY
jgi:predicted phage terminase large subunit-like protein